MYKGQDSGQHYNLSFNVNFKCYAIKPYSADKALSKDKLYPLEIVL